MPGIRSILWSHSWCLGSRCASSSEKTLPYCRNSGGISIFFGCSALARVVDTVVCATTGSYRGEACCDAFWGGTADVTAGPMLRRETFRDVVLGGTVDVTTGPYRGEAFLDADLGGTV